MRANSALSKISFVVLSGAGSLIQSLMEQGLLPPLIITSSFDTLPDKSLSYLTLYMYYINLFLNKNADVLLKISL